ncbi:MAG TPA: AsmA-like C-terminal region-containing protein [Burkholderiales bacterium]|nr:AsmA-like C-terminal region-containing protein [Burkholderiales bacterium]
MKVSKRLMTGALAVVAVLLAAPLLLPANLFVPQVERLASEALMDSVRVGGVRLVLLPVPGLTVRDIMVGKRAYLQVEKLSIVPRLSTVFAQHKVIRRIGLSGVTIRRPFLDKLEQLGSKNGGAARSVDVRHVSLRRVHLDLGEVTLAAVEADIELAPNNALRSILARHGGDRLRLSIVPRGKAYALKVFARDWHLPAGPPLRIAALEANGEFSGSGLTLPEVRARLYDGELSGRFSLSWTPGWRLAGEFELRQVDLKPVAALYSREAAISGWLAATGVIDMQAPSAAALIHSPGVGIDFSVSDGILHRVDLVAAAKFLPGKNRVEAQAGQTKFDRLSGHLWIDAEGFHFTDLEIASGVLEARGHVSISPQQALSGRVDATLKGTGSLVGTPLALSGTVDSPKVLPTKGTLAGAAAGTLLLGPGVGTTLGMKAAELTERLFGKKPPKAKRPGAKQATEEQGTSPAKAGEEASAPPAGRR